MKILLFGEYSNVHATLAAGLRARGHHVVVTSDGDGWKDYPRDVDIRRGGTGLCGTAVYAARLARALPRMRGFDVVQIINPMMLELKAERQMAFYRFLRRNNGRLVMGAFGMDHYWVRACTDGKTFRYSDFMVGERMRDYPQAALELSEWGEGGAKAELNKRIAADCDAIVAGLYEYYEAYRPHFPDKTTFIPMPVATPPLCAPATRPLLPIRFFIGVQRARSEYKGTDIMMRALRRLESDFPDRVRVNAAENVPFEEYKRLIEGSDVLLDQLYGYTPAMNALLAMSKGLVVVGGGEPEGYELLNERELRPCVNVRPDEEDVYRQMRDELVLHPERVPQLAAQSVEYVRRHHAVERVAERYESFYESL